MPVAVSPPRRAGSAPNDDLDNMFADLIREDVNNDNHQANDEFNNMDEEIKITKKRKPVAKLDENRLLSTAGIPKLRKIAKDKLKFNGKGNEFTDMARLLNTYQLWLDDMFPKAKFLDGLAMIEKLGHKKKIQIYRKEWIDEGRTRRAEDDDDMDDYLERLRAEESERRPEAAQNQSVMLSEERDTPDASTRREAGAKIDGQQEDNNQPDDDELDAILGDTAVRNSQPSVQNDKPLQDDQEPDEDELDALLAEDAQTSIEHKNKSLFGGPAQTDNTATERLPSDFGDEEEAMAGMDW
ncbi:replication fork protection component Swi3-domain-containing protein [Delphinella strobiligena]|nr:replication fork protection component Swi3-domain-containing protein [Delphinella strobiligena]